MIANRVLGQISALLDLVASRRIEDKMRSNQMFRCFWELSLGRSDLAPVGDVASYVTSENLGGQASGAGRSGTPNASHDIERFVYKDFVAATQTRLRSSYCERFVDRMPPSAQLTVYML